MGMGESGATVSALTEVVRVVTHGPMPPRSLRGDAFWLHASVVGAQEDKRVRLASEVQQGGASLPGLRGFPTDTRGGWEAQHHCGHPPNAAQRKRPGALAPGLLVRVSGPLAAGLGRAAALSGLEGGAAGAGLDGVRVV